MDNDMNIAVQPEDVFSPEAAQAGSFKMGSLPQKQQESRLSDKAVMQHTASIWRYRTVTEDGTELHTEYHSKYLREYDTELIAARVRGKKHKHDGSNCDDWFEASASGGCIIAAVADGAGSRPLSRIGARVSCEAAVNHLKQALSDLMEVSPEIKRQLSSDMSGEEFMTACGRMAQIIQASARSAFDAVLKKLAEIAEDKAYIKVLGRVPAAADLSSTFLAAVAVPLEVNGERQTFVMSVQIGDGCICAIDSSKDSGSCFRLLGEADSGAYSGETDFLSAKTVSEGFITGKTRISRGKSDILMLMTDGVADDYFPAQPMMKRLCLDLCLNGIIPMSDITDRTEECVEPQPPEPLKYPTLGIEQRSVAIQYAKQLSDGISDEEINSLWDRRSSIRPYSLEAYGISLGASPQKRLLNWLDNYNERGSFDDRTLVVIRLNAGHEQE